jgi:hypothetical protein
MALAHGETIGRMRKKGRESSASKKKIATGNATLQEAETCLPPLVTQTG